MTTVAWDGRTLAGDTQATRGCMRNHCERKVFRIERDRDVVLLGISGSEGDAMRVVDWVRNGESDATRPKLEPDSFNAILVTADDAYRLDAQLYRLKLMEPFHAIGAGRDFAMAAMHLGKSAREAVELAAHYDIYTGGAIIEVSL